MEVCSDIVKITPEALEQFIRIYRKKNPQQPPLRKPEKTLRKIVRKAYAASGPLHEMLEKEKPEGIGYLVDTSWVFTIREEPQPTLIRVDTYSEVRAKYHVWEKADRPQERKKRNAKERVAQVPSVDLARVCFNPHALKRFIERFGASSEEAESAARLRLGRATERGETVLWEK